MHTYAALVLFTVDRPAKAKLQTLQSHLSTVSILQIKIRPKRSPAHRYALNWKACIHPSSCSRSRCQQPEDRKTPRAVANSGRSFPVISKDLGYVNSMIKRHCSNLWEENWSIRSKIQELFMWLGAHHCASTQSPKVECASNVLPNPEQQACDCVWCKADTMP